MPIYKPTQINQSTAQAFNFLPAQLKKLQSGWIIEYYCENPYTQEFVRVRRKVNNIRRRYKSSRDAEIHINKIVLDLNCKMSAGINPIFQGGTEIASYTPILELLDKFIDQKKSDLRPDTIRAYSSHVKIFATYIKNKGIVSVGHFSKLEAVRFMDAVSSKGISARTFNNKLKLMRILWGWMVEHGYSSENVFDSIKTKRMEAKHRTLIDKQTRSRIAEYFSKNAPPMVIVCELVFSALIRPKEIRNLLVSDIDFNGCSITIRSDNAKNHHQRIVPISERLMLDIKKHIQQNPKKNYVFGPLLIPGAKPCGSSYVIKIWERMKQKLQLDNSVQLYGLRDTGISEMIKSGIDPLTVKQLADHHSLAITSIYTDHADPNLRDALKNSPTF